MRVLVTGGGGLLAHALIPILREQGDEVVALDRGQLDVTDRAMVRTVFADVRPEAVAHCAAYTAVDAAEENQDEAFRVNAEGTATIADACQRCGSLLVYPSTDYVFGGRSSRPYRPDDPVEPLGVYGRSKAAGEEAVRRAGRFLVVRTSWLYGAGGPNFVETILRLARERDRLEVVDDQVGRPTWSRTIGRTIARLLKIGALGTFHATDAGEPVSWHGFARKIVEFEGLEVAVAPVTSDVLDRPASRPEYSVLDCSTTEEILGEPLPEWEKSLARYLLAASAVRSH